LHFKKKIRPRVSSWQLRRNVEKRSQGGNLSKLGEGGVCGRKVLRNEAPLTLVSFLIREGEIPGGNKGKRDNSFDCEQI